MALTTVDISQLSTTNSSNNQIISIVNGNVTYTNTISPFIFV